MCNVESKIATNGVFDQVVRAYDLEGYLDGTEMSSEIKL